MDRKVKLYVDMSTASFLDQQCYLLKKINWANKFANKIDAVERYQHTA